MASNPEFAEFIADQLREAGSITYKKMFGEYGIFCNGKIIAVICDNQLFFKITEAGRALRPNLPEKPPHTGPKKYFLIDNPDEREFLTKLATVTYEALPEPKLKKKRKESAHGL